MNYELPTVDGKKIHLVNPKIVISKNSKIESGYFVDLKLVGTLPGCRKEETLTYSFGYDGKTMVVTTLFNYRKHCNVSKEEIKKLILSVPVTPPNYSTEPVELTPELIAFARKEKSTICL